MLLFEAGQFEAAAERFLMVANRAPDHRHADLALHDAAVAYERIGRFGSASKIYERIYTTYVPCSSPTLEPGEKCSEVADLAVLCSGVNHARYFEFEEALDKYLILATGDDYSASEFRLLALRRAARLHDDLRQYDESAKLYEEIARQAKLPSEKAEAMFSRAEVLAKTGDANKTIAAYEDFVEDHGGQPMQAVLEVEARLRLGLLFRDLGRHEDAKRQLSLALERFNRELQPATPEAALPAEAQFILAEYALEDMMRLPLGSSDSEELGRESKKLFDALVEVVGAYDKVFDYRSFDWVIAAMYRRGQAFEMAAKRVVDAPVPVTFDGGDEEVVGEGIVFDIVVDEEVVDEEVVDEKVVDAPVPGAFEKGSDAHVAYQRIIAEHMKPFVQKAIGLYEECVKRGKQFGVTNAWTVRALERLAVHKPDEYPTLHDAALVFVLEDRR